MSEPVAKTIARLTAALPDEYADTLNNRDKLMNWNDTLRELLIAFFKTPESPQNMNEETSRTFVGDTRDPFNMTNLVIADDEFVCVKCTMVQRQLYPHVFGIVVHTPSQRARDDYEAAHNIGYVEQYDFTGLTEYMSHVDQKTVIEYVMRAWDALDRASLSNILIQATMVNDLKIDVIATYDHRPGTIAKVVNQLLHIVGGDAWDKIGVVTQEYIREFRDGVRERFQFSTNHLSMILSRLTGTTGLDEDALGYLTEALSPIETMYLLVSMEKQLEGFGCMLRASLRYYNGGGEGTDEWPTLITGEA